MVADRIRIEDEVWEEAFATRVRSRPRRVHRHEPRPVPAPSVEPADEARFLQPVARESALAARVPFGVDRPASSAEVVDFPAPAPEEHAEPLARRTIHIQGRGAERHLPAARPYSSAASRRRRSLLDEYSGFQPDRLAMWAMLLGVALMAVAILSSGF